MSPGVICSHFVEMGVQLGQKFGFNRHCCNQWGSSESRSYMYLSTFSISFTLFSACRTLWKKTYVHLFAETITLAV